MEGPTEFWHTDRFLPTKTKRNCWLRSTKLDYMNSHSQPLTQTTDRWQVDQVSDGQKIANRIVCWWYKVCLDILIMNTVWKYFTWDNPLCSTLLLMFQCSFMTRPDLTTSGDDHDITAYCKSDWSLTFFWIINVWEVWNNANICILNIVHFNNTSQLSRQHLQVYYIQTQFQAGRSRVGSAL